MNSKPLSNSRGELAKTQKILEVHIVIYTADIMAVNKPFSPKRSFEMLFNVAKNRYV